MSYQMILSDSETINAISGIGVLFDELNVNPKSSYDSQENAELFSPLNEQRTGIGSEMFSKKI